MTASRQNVELLPPKLAGTVKEMLYTGSTYDEIIDYLRQNGMPAVGAETVFQFARSCRASAAMLHMAQRNFRLLMDQIDDDPDLDTTEAIVRLACQHVLSAMADTDEKSWAKLDKSKLLDSAAGLIRAAAYKRQTEQAARSSGEKAAHGFGRLFFEAMAREEPALYKEVSAYLQKKQNDLADGAPASPSRKEAAP